MSADKSPSVLFTPVRIGSLTVPNRFVRSATNEFMADDKGYVTHRQESLFHDLAEGEVGLIITGHTYIDPEGRAVPRQTSISDDAYSAGLGRIASAVHAFPSRIFVQLAHAGRQTKVSVIGGTPIAPSPVFEPTFKLIPREATSEDIVRIIDAFVQGARRAREAGFDGVQIHAAHGYLLSSFLSPHTNRRTDSWGGSTAGRAHIVLEILRGIKRACGDDFPVIAKLNAEDFLETGLQVEESLEIARLMQSAGLDGVEVSGGMTEAGRGSVWPGLRTEKEEGYFVEHAARFKAVLSVPVFGLGGNRTFRVMEGFVRDGKVDLLSLSRPLVRDPHLVKKFRLGLIAKSDCISCNKCFNPRGLSCGDLKAARRKA